jgi:hypothetical protein
MKFCKTPISGLFGFSNACLPGVSGLGKSLYLTLQLFGLVGQIFCFARLVNRFGSKDPDHRIGNGIYWVTAIRTRVELI